MFLIKKCKVGIDKKVKFGYLLALRFGIRSLNENFQFFVSVGNTLNDVHGKL